MADYNPSQPIILGQEWVPIREEQVVFNESVNSVEMGHSFELLSSTQLSIGRFYVNKFPTSGMDNQVYTMSVYEKGREDQSGPVKSLIIPCNSVASTGLGAQTGTLDLVTRVSNSSADPDLGIFIGLGTSTVRNIQFFFAVNQYSAILSGKRILGVNFLSNRRFTNVSGVSPPNPTMLLSWRNESATNQWNFPIYADNLVRQGTNNPRTDKLGDVDRFFGGSVANTVDTIPLTYPALQKFEATAGVSRVHMHINVPGNLLASTGTFVWINYAALEVFYCEETRVAFGTRIYNPWQQTPFLTDSPIMLGIPYQTCPVVMRDLNGVANPSLPAGEYVVTVSQANMGDDLEAVSNSGPHAELNGLRELYQIPGLDSVQVNIPFPLDLNVTRTPHTFSSQYNAILPQLSLHATGGAPFTQVHAYGRQAVAQVWGTNTAIQDIDESPLSGVSYEYPWVRYVARRFGDTTVPLTLTGAGTLSGSAVSITVAEFDALDEILDGWKEVTLRFTVPPSMGTVTGIPGWAWSAAGETAGNRWEVLGACAPAISGLPGNLLNLAVPPSSQLGPATYGAGSAVTPAFVSVGVAAHGNNASVVPGMPGSIVRGDTLLILAAIRNSPTGSPDTPTGYTLLHSNSNMRLFGKIYDGSETAPTVSFSNGVANATTSAQMCAFRNVTLSVVASNSTSNASQVNIDYPAIAAAAMEDNTVVLFLGWRQQDWVSVATIAGATEIGEPSTGTGDNQGIVWDFVVRGAAAAVGSGQFVVTDAFSAIGRGSVVVLRHADPGSEVELTWMPQGVGSPYVTSPSADATSDGFLIFSQDPPMVSGFTVSTLTQPLSGIGQECGVDPCCVPTALSYNQLTWTASSGPYSVELQRMDTVDTDWQTIMLNTAPASGAGVFNDYEARVGILASYRIREVNQYDFVGSWSDTVTATIDEPGVTIGCEGHVLIFTSNEVQDGSINLAYSNAWMGQVQENFSFPEAATVQLQAMYDRDFVTAFHSPERGGERFEREILVQAAAISPPTLGDFRGLRDMAWADVSYICVRDEEGNRWFATVLVPSGRVAHFRKIYMATIGIVEVTDTPSPVNP